MEYIIGVFVGLSLSAIAISAYILGTRQHKPKIQVNEDAKRRAEELQRGFAQLMSYDVNTALRGKR